MIMRTVNKGHEYWTRSDYLTWTCDSSVGVDKVNFALRVFET